MFSKPFRLIGMTAALAVTAGGSFAAGAAMVAPDAVGNVTSLASSESAVVGIKYVKHNVNPLPSDTFFVSVTCPLGFRAFAGGGQTSATDLFITDSYRDTGDPRTWHTRWETDNDTNVDPSFVTTNAFCAHV